MGKTITEQGELVGICGWDGSEWKPVLIDGSQRFVIAVGTILLPADAALESKQLPNDHDVTVSNPISGFATSAKQLADGHNVVAKGAGGDKILSISGIVEEALLDNDIGSGTVSIHGTVVPNGEIHVITAASIQYLGTVPTRIYLMGVDLAAVIVPLNVESPVSGRWYTIILNLYLQEGDNMACAAEGATAGDDLYLRYGGYKMSVP